MRQTRNSIFETNSSSTHSVSIHFGKWDFSVSANIDPTEVPDNIDLDDFDLSYILSNIPTEELEYELECRKEDEKD